MFAGTGAGIVMINQLSFLVQSRGAPPDGQDLDVALLSVFKCVCVLCGAR